MDQMSLFPLFPNEPLPSCLNGWRHCPLLSLPATAGKWLPAGRWGTASGTAFPALHGMSGASCLKVSKSGSTVCSPLSVCPANVPCRHGFCRHCLSFCLECLKWKFCSPPASLSGNVCTVCLECPAVTHWMECFQMSPNGRPKFVFVRAFKDIERWHTMLFA